jgi:hypothetical protein
MSDQPQRGRGVPTECPDRWDSAHPVVPFDDAGNLLDYPEAWRGLQWRLLEPFEASLTVLGVERGRSAARFVLGDDDGYRYPLFMTDMLTLLTSYGVEGGGRTPRLCWGATKRGTNYGITPFHAA